jgi:ribonuclease P protein component
VTAATSRPSCAPARNERVGWWSSICVRGEDEAVRVAVVASRKVGSAVARNRAKRLLREAARHVAWRPGTEVVLVARARAREAHRTR